jgi:hypothetical protein
MPSNTAGQEPGQPRLAHAERQFADVLAVADQDIEGVELDLGIMPARVQAVEIGPAVDAEQHGFAIEHERGIEPPSGTLHCPQPQGLSLRLGP